MLEIYWAVLIGVAALFVGVIIGFFVFKSKNSAAKKENLQLRSEADALRAEVNLAAKKREELIFDIAEKERSLAVAEAMLKTECSLRTAAEEDAAVLKTKNEELRTAITGLSAKAAATQEANSQLKEWIGKAEIGLKDSFESLSKNITENNNRVFLETAGDKMNGVLSPMQNVLKELREKVDDIEAKRAAAYSGLTEQVNTLQKQNSELKSATDILSGTLKNNAQRGKWGEEQLHRIAELAGMVEHIDFEEQEVKEDKSRPDMVIHLSGGRTVPVDSKAPMNSYLLYLDDTDEQSRAKHLAEHVRALRAHVDVLNKKAYWQNEQRSPEMVAMVVPYESGLSAAFTADREIFGYAMQKNVLLLSPMTFYAFLKSVSIGWQENAMSQNALEIAKQSRELIKRFEVFYRHFDSIDKSIANARSAFDSAVSSYNSRLLPSFNRFRALSNGGQSEEPLLEEYAQSDENM